MDSKKIVSLVLLLFVGAAMIYLVTSETEAPTSEETAAVAEPSGAIPAAGRVVTVTYFHGDRRCVTCNKLEKYSSSAVHEHFADQLAAGGLVWQVTNYDEAGNEHYVDDYSLPYQSLVLQEYVDGKPGEWVNLNKIWDLVNDEAAFDEYVRAELVAFLERS